MPCRLERMILNALHLTSRVCLLTIHDNPQILDEFVDDLENLQCGRPSLVQGESVKPP